MMRSTRMARMGSPATAGSTQSLFVQASGASSATHRIIFELPDDVPNILSLEVSPGGESARTTLASFSNPTISW